MELLMPYLVLVGVSILFFAVCYYFFSNGEEESLWQEVDDREQTVKAIEREEPAVQVQEMTMSIPVITENDESALYIEDSMEDNDENMTRIMPKVVADKERNPEEMDVTAALRMEDMEALVEEEFTGEHTVAVEAFLRIHGAISAKTKKYLYEITEEAFDELGGVDEDTRRTILENLEVQEALLCMQKAYCTTPTEWMKKNAIAIFMDVMQQPRSSTLSLVAFDALHILSRLSLGQFQGMALTLLFRYSINSNNYSLERFRHYVKKYVEPFMSELPEEKEAYTQLQYLQCIVHEEPMSFMNVLGQNYPLVSRYMGADVEEWTAIVPGIEKSLVESIVAPSLYKLPIVNDAMADRFFRREKISDVAVQKELMKLMHKRPYRLSQEKGMDVLRRISPTLIDVNDLFNRTDLSRMKLSLVGLYLARTHVHSTIGEKFDLSRWF